MDEKKLERVFFDLIKILAAEQGLSRAVVAAAMSRVATTILAAERQRRLNEAH